MSIPPNDSAYARSDSFLAYALGERRADVTKLPIAQRLFALPAYHWVLLAVVLTALTHSAHAPMWLVALIVISSILQLPSIRHHVNRITGKRLISSYRLLQYAVFALGVVGLVLSFGLSLGAEVAIGFLLLCLGAKLWELHKRRDAYVVLNLSLFVLAAAFLWTQGVLMALAVLVALLSVLMGFITLSDDGNPTGAGRIRSLALVTLPAVPLLVLLFLFFPRIPPLWSFQAMNKSATTGVSDHMSAGDFSQLSRSTELAFRVEFLDGQRPSRSDMYWRGMVFSHFDGQTWRQSDFSQAIWSSQDALPTWAIQAYQGRAQGRYQVILEPTNQHWLFALDYPKPVAAPDIGMNQEFNLRTALPVSQQRRYQVAHHPDAKIDVTLSSAAQRIHTQLPNGNPKSRALAQSFYTQARGDTQQMIALIQAHMTREPFRYTLSPPLLDGERVDQFLFETRAGFCEHYASSFVFLMRAAGVPARVVAGYQGGELGRDGRSWEVRQMDAHAWAEVWLEGTGWARIDPTGFVSPERIDVGMNALTDAAGGEMFGDGVIAQLGYQQFRLSQSLRRYADQLSYYWQKDVVGFDQERQKNALLKWLNLTKLSTQLMLLAGLFTLLFVLFSAVIWLRRRRHYHPYDKAVLALSARLKRKDAALARAFDEPVLSYLIRLSTQANIPYDRAQALARHYRQARFGKDHANIDRHALSAFKRQLSALGELLG